MILRRGLIRPGFHTTDSGAVAAVAFPTVTGLQYRWRADEGVTGDPVTAWATVSDSPSSKTLTGTGADFGATDGPNGTPAITFDGSNDQLVGTLTIAQPFHICYVMQQVTWTANDRIMEIRTDGNALIRQRQSGGVGAYEIRHSFGLGGKNMVNPTDALWHAYECFGSGAASYQELDGTRVSGENPGTDGMTALSLASTYAGGNYANIAFAEIFLLDQDLDAGERANVETYMNSRYDITFA
tara:strand:+ start:4278 stop:5000 length:723 start_codon:yes stop_codon:yes gene_type:complete